MANTLSLFRQGVVGFIDWLDKLYTYCIADRNGWMHLAASDERVFRKPERAAESLEQALALQLS